MGVALSSAIIAAFAALASLLAGANANKAMIDQMKASDAWSYYQAKGIKSNLLKSKVELLATLGKPKGANDQKKLDQYENDQQEIMETADTLQKESRKRLEIHESMAKSVTMFQVAIAIAAISALTRKRVFWYVGLLASVVGLYVFFHTLPAYFDAEKFDQEQEAKEAKEEDVQKKAAAHAEKPEGKHAKPEKSAEGAGAEKPSPSESAAPAAAHEKPAAPKAEQAAEPAPAAPTGH